MEMPHGSVIRPNRVVLATDGSEDATLAARVATDLSRRSRAVLHVAHAWRDHFQVLGYPTLEGLTTPTSTSEKAGACSRPRWMRSRPWASSPDRTYFTARRSTPSWTFARNSDPGSS